MEIRWKVTDPLGNEIFLTEKNLPSENLDERIKYVVEHPRFIIKAPNSSEKIYLNLIDMIRKDLIAIRAVEVIVNEHNEIVTWLIRRTINDTLTQGEVIYDKRTYCL